MLLELRDCACAVAIACVLAAPAAPARAQPADAAQIQALYQQGERALAERRYADAEQAYERLRQLQPALAEVHARLGLIDFQQGKFADAVPPLRRALKLKPALPNVGHAAGDVAVGDRAATRKRCRGSRRRSTSRQPTPPSAAWPACTCSAPTPTSIATATPSPCRSS